MRACCRVVDAARDVAVGVGGRARRDGAQNSREHGQSPSFQFGRRSFCPAVATDACDATGYVVAMHRVCANTSGSRILMASHEFDNLYQFSGKLTCMLTLQSDIDRSLERGRL